jgi:hypothetical protein
MSDFDASKPYAQIWSADGRLGYEQDGVVYGQNGEPITWDEPRPPDPEKPPEEPPPELEVDPRA